MEAITKRIRRMYGAWTLTVSNYMIVYMCENQSSKQQNNVIMFKKKLLHRLKHIQGEITGLLYLVLYEINT